MSDVSMYCANCEYWDCSDKEFESHNLIACGQCRRYPPSIPVFENSNVNSWKVKNLLLCLFKGIAFVDFPPTLAENWCGEFKPMKNPRWVKEGEEYNE